MQRICKTTICDETTARQALLTGIALIILQGLDGILTSIGVERFGVAIEGNPLVRNLMHQIGHIPALGLVKCAAVFIILALMYQARRLPWINSAMGAIGAIYVFVAIIPWTYILFFRPYL